jgi:hypothetical protein
MKITRWLILFVLLGSCKDKYTAPVHIPASGYLVVEGFINAGSGSTDFTLTRATGLDSPYVLPEAGASVSVESGDGSQYSLTENGNGSYSIDQLPLDLNQQYRVRIKTTDGKEYLSDLTSVKITPPVDSVSWKAEDGGVRIFVSTHDPTNNSRYYQWNYEETWEYESGYLSDLEYQGGGRFVSRPPADQVHVCYIGDLSTTISIGSTAKLNDDVLFEYPLTFIPYLTSNKLSRKYSILVKQYALTKEWYEWKEKVKKNTEQLGSIFDAQPSDISGNIHCISNPGEPVIGYVGCTSETEKRRFIDNAELPKTRVHTGYEQCVADTIPNAEPDITNYFGSGVNLPIVPIYSRTGPGIVAYTGASAFCVDCREAGGVTIKPDFWQ